VNSSTTCCHCGVAFDARAWEGLELVELVGAERVREHVTTWPGVTRIEVRRCRCGRTLARKAAGRVGDSATEPFAPAGSAPVGQPDPR